MTRKTPQHRLRRDAGVIALAAAATLAVGAAALTHVSTQAGPCEVQHGPVRLRELAEASGLAVSRRHPGVLWSHNDSGNDAVLFAVDADGTPRGRIALPLKTRDWEDISAGRCANADCLYVADIGDNRASRRDVTIYRLPEPDLGEAAAAAVASFPVKYPDGPHNAEAMFVINDDIFIVTRDRTGFVYRAFMPAKGGTIAPKRVGSLGLTTVTDAETSTDGRSVVVRTSYEALLYRTDDVLAGRFAPYQRIPLEGLREIQGEAVAMDGDRLYLASENGAFGSTGSLITLRCDFSARPPADVVRQQ